MAERLFAAVFEFLDVAASNAFATLGMLFYLNTADDPKVARVTRMKLAFETLRPDLVLTAHVNKGAVVAAVSGPAPLYV